MTGNKKDGITVEKGTQVIKFDFRVETPKGVLWCAYIKQPESNGEIAAGMSNNKSINQTKESVQKLTPAIKMNIERAHAILGHSSKETMQRMAAALGMGITRGTLKTCKSCAIAKAKQKNLNNESEGAKADRFNGQLYHNIATVKESGKDKSLSHRMVWRITAKETVNFKQSTFFVYKSNMPKNMCAFMQQEKSRGHPIKIIRQDNAGENKKLVTFAHSQDWKLDTIF